MNLPITVPPPVLPGVFPGRAAKRFSEQLRIIAGAVDPGAGRNLGNRFVGANQAVQGFFETVAIQVFARRPGKVGFKRGCSMFF